MKSLVSRLLSPLVVSAIALSPIALIIGSALAVEKVNTQVNYSDVNVSSEKQLETFVNDLKNLSLLNVRSKTNLEEYRLTTKLLLTKWDMLTTDENIRNLPGTYYINTAVSIYRYSLDKLDFSVGSSVQRRSILFIQSNAVDYIIAYRKHKLDDITSIKTMCSTKSKTKSNNAIINYGLQVCDKYYHQ